MENRDITVLGKVNFRNSQNEFGINGNDRTRHVYVIGQTGMGKSTLLLNMIAQDLQSGKGLALVDPHGDLVENVLERVPPHRINDVVYVNPSDLNHPVGFNPMDGPVSESKHLTASGLIEVFKKIWIDSWGPRLEYVFRNVILALLEAGGNTLLGTNRMLIDTEFRADTVRMVKDPVVKTFWQVEYELYPKVFRTETISPIQNKVGQFLSTPLVRNILGQVRTRFDMRNIMDSGKILLVNLSKGQLGEDNSALLGSLLLTKLFLTAMTRAKLSERDRRPFAVYIDEFQCFAADSFTSTLSEMRKYGLQLVLAHQHLSQLPDSLRSAVFGNVGTIISFRIGAEDGEYLQREFEPIFYTQDLLSLPAFHVYLKMSIDGKTSEPFSATTIPPVTRSHSTRHKIIEQSRQRYSTPRSVVEEQIHRWMNQYSLVE